MTIALPRRGEVWLTRLDPTEGNEIRKTRPCLVISPDDMNDRLGTIAVMAMTSGSRAAPFRVPITYRGVPGFLLGDQVRSVSKSRLLKRLGRIDQASLCPTLAVLREMFEE